MHLRLKTDCITHPHLPLKRRGLRLSGETADPENIQQEANQMFSRYGSRIMKKWEVRPLTSDVKIVDMYQMAKPVPPSGNSVPAAAGRVGCRLGPNLRTTLIIKNQAGQWKVLAARVADV